MVVDLFAMCSAQRIVWYALAADGVDICAAMFDGDLVKEITNLKWIIVIRLPSILHWKKAEQYEFSDIDMTSKDEFLWRKIILL
jgi:hypothetical protein